MAIITSLCNPFNKLSARLPKKESTILTLRCNPITTSVTSYSFAVWIIPEAILRSYRLTCDKGTSADAAIIAARSRFLLPHNSKRSELLLSLMTFNASKLFFCLESRISKDKFIKSSIVSGFATGIKIFSGVSFLLFSVSSCASCIASLRAARSVANELMMQVNRINTIVPFNTSSFNNRSPSGKIIL